MTSVRTDPAYPCQEPPPIKPFNGFDINGESDRTIATRIIAEILADDQWHTREEIADELAYELDWAGACTGKLLGCLKSHGDIRTDNVGNYRLTTRWRSYPDQSATRTTVNQVEALRETIKLAEQQGMPETPGSDQGLGHLRSMLASVEGSEFSDAKLGRWLGWAQCAVVTANVGVTLADMKALNARWANDDEH